MPVIKSAIKKLRKDVKRTKRNDEFRSSLNRALQAAKTQKSAKAVSSAVSLVDRAVKKNEIHKNRAARIKSGLAKLAKPEKSTKAAAPKKEAAKPKTKTPKKTSKKS